MGKDVTLEEGKQIKKFADVLGLNDLKPIPQVHEDKLWQVMTQEIAADSAVQAIESRGFCLESCITNTFKASKEMICPYQLFGAPKEDAKNGTEEASEFETVEDKEVCGCIKYRVHHPTMTPIGPLEGQPIFMTRYKCVKRLIKLERSFPHRAMNYTKKYPEAWLVSGALMLILIPALANFTRSLNLFNRTGQQDIYYDLAWKKALTIVGAILFFYTTLCLRMCILPWKDSRMLMLSYVTVTVFIAAWYFIFCMQEAPLLSSKGKYRWEQMKQAMERNSTPTDQSLILHTEKSLRCCGFNGYMDYPRESLPQRCFKTNSGYINFKTDPGEAELNYLAKPPCSHVLARRNYSQSRIMSYVMVIALFTFLVFRAPYLFHLKRDDRVTVLLICMLLGLTGIDKDESEKKRDLAHLFNSNQVLNGILNSELDNEVSKLKKQIKSLEKATAA